MIIFKDIISGDEMFSDSYTMKLIDDLYYEVDGASLTENTGIDESKIGANASAEGGGDEVADSAVTEIDIVRIHHLQKMDPKYTKKEYKSYISGYAKEIKTRLAKSNPERVDPFMKGMQKFIKTILEQYKDFDIYMGENMNHDGMLPLLNYREDGVTPYFIYFKDGLEQEKY
ncbi:translationally-controlled tumor protein homolog [Saccoglossus kowalevskii]|uniref:Translationally-controlled tumor protein homolog n=1 Tax=Saccoglossus kowalevskii TaxID=10224 RepID=A0ABM0GYJ0_SACKO|nr:PREDICTED: translationally-controlled tumor protein homolog [Saccoglossus kowalevskii]